MKIIGSEEELQAFREGCNRATCNNCALDEICNNQYILTAEYTAAELETISEFLDNVALAREHYVNEDGTIYTTNKLVSKKSKIEPILITNKEVQK